MNKDNTVSVIMSCYNSEKTMRKAIDSIFAQTYDNWIMICCDDGSTDGTWSVLNEYKDKYPEKFVIMRNKKNRKLPYSLNRCLKKVNTDLVARMDADDWCLPERFEKQVSFLKAHPEYDLVGTGVTVFDGSRQIASIIGVPEPTKQSMMKSNAFSHATIMTYKHVYEALGGYSTDPTAERVEDVDLWCRFLAAGFKGYNLPDELYVMVENVGAAKRRTFRARLNSARTRARGYKLMGIKGVQRYLPYVYVLKAFVPVKVYQIIHKKKLQRKQNHSR